MRLKVEKENASDSPYVESGVLFREEYTKSLLPLFRAELDTINAKVVSMSTDEEKVALIADFRSLIEEYKAKLGLLIHDAMFDLSMPINISNFPSVESNKRAGLLYFDVTNNRLRISTNSGWKTVKLE